MRSINVPRGVFVPACTPFRNDLSVDEERFVAHCRWLLDEGADGLAVFGTTSEANSLAASERMSLLERLIDDKVSPAVLMPGTGCCALPDTVALTRHAVNTGCMGVLLLPPFYYKGSATMGCSPDFRADPADRRHPAAHLSGTTSPDGSRFLVAADRTAAECFRRNGRWNRTARATGRIAAMLRDRIRSLSRQRSVPADALRRGGAGCIQPRQTSMWRRCALINAWTTPAALCSGNVAGGGASFRWCRPIRRCCREFTTQRTGMSCGRRSCRLRPTPQHSFSAHWIRLASRWSAPPPRNQPA